MAITLPKIDSFHNSAGATELYLDLADVEAGRILWVWASYIVWNITGFITRVFYQDGATEIDLVQTDDTGINVNPRIFLWRLSAVPAKIDPGARVVVQFNGGDRRITCVGYSVRGVDPLFTIPGITAANDQATDKKFTNVTLPAPAAPGCLLDFVTALRGGSVPKPDYSPVTAGLSEIVDTVAFPGSLYFGSASGEKSAPDLIPYPLSWQVSPDFDTAWNHAGVVLEAEENGGPVQAGTVAITETQAFTVTEEVV